MNKSKIIMYTTIGLMSLLLVYVMFIQFRIVNETDTEGIEFMRETELREMLASYKASYAEVEEEIEETTKMIEEYKQNEKSEEATVKLLEKDLADARMKLGITDVYGEGITITMQASEEKKIEFLEEHILLLTNELFLAGAEAISINDQRIVAMSDIVNPGNFILINNERVTSPFVIKVIGDTKYLQSALNIKGGYIDTYGEKYGITVEVGNVTINKYNKNITLKYEKG